MLNRPVPLGINGIEYVEYATQAPQAFGAALEQLGLHAIARHRSREITLYRAGGMNVIVNSHLAAERDNTDTRIVAFALRVQDASIAYEHCVARGAWPIKPHVGAMELNIPGVCSVGNSTIYFVDRYDEFKIYDVDFKAIAGVNQDPPAIEGMHFFGIVQAIAAGRSKEWSDFYAELFGFSVLPDGLYFGVLPKGTLLESPCHRFYLQLVEPPETTSELNWEERLTRIGLGAPNIPALVATLSDRGVRFVESSVVHTSDKGAVTYLGGTSFEFVKSHIEAAA
jgi:4-hydroxyphenylpyruvate dioxygenase